MELVGIIIFYLLGSWVFVRTIAIESPDHKYQYRKRKIKDPELIRLRERLKRIENREV